MMADKDGPLTAKGPFQDRLEAFKAWCNERGISLENCSIEQTPTMGLTVIARKDIPPNTPALSVPSNALLTVARAFRSEVGQAVLNSHTLNGEQLSAQALMYLVLINGRTRAEDPLHPWLAMLPDAFDDPLWWGPEERQTLLHDTYILYETQRHEAMLRNVYDGLFPALSEELPDFFPKDVYTFQAFLWARSALASRSFSSEALLLAPQCLLSDEERAKLRPDCPVFQCPLLDFTNHDPSLKVHVQMSSSNNNNNDDSNNSSNNNSATVESKDKSGNSSSASSSPSLHLTHEASIQSGAEILNNYGACRTNLQLLIGYGFCIEDNGADELPLRLGAPANLSRVKKGALQKAGLQPGEGFTLLLDGQISPRLLAVMRVLMMTESGLTAKAKSVGAGPLKKAAISEAPPPDDPGRMGLYALLQEELKPDDTRDGLGELEVLDMLRWQLKQKLKKHQSNTDRTDARAKAANAYHAGQRKILAAVLARVKDLEESYRRRYGFPKADNAQEGEEGAEEEAKEVDEAVEPEPDADLAYQQRPAKKPRTSR